MVCSDQILLDDISEKGININYTSSFRSQATGHNMNQQTVRKLVSLSLLISVLPIACTWVDLDEGAKEVVLIEANQAAACKLLGSAASMSADKVGLLNRKDAKVAVEVLTLAKNSAAEMGGNAISAVDVLTDGKQTFNVYLCPAP
jgi:hypothetical protein